MWITAHGSQGRPLGAADRPLRRWEETLSGLTNLAPVVLEVFRFWAGGFRRKLQRLAFEMLEVGGYGI